jgi:1,4-dihydroxy-2-naphthoate polyprenyltransferase
MANRWVLGARPRTLPAAVVPVLVGTAVAYGATELIVWRAVAALVVAVAIQVATNYVNDYADGERGTDDARVGPPRLVGSKLATVKEVKVAALAATGVAAVAGLALTVAIGPQLLVVGLACFAAGFFYTGGSRPYGYSGMGEIFVFLFFGVVATVGSAYVQFEELTLLSFGASVPVGLLATSLLVVNNLRDIPGDTAVAKRTLAVRMGDESTRALYLALVVGAFVSVPVIALARPLALVALLAVPLTVPPLRRITGGSRGQDLVPALVGTGTLQLAFGMLLAAGLALSA